MVHKYERHAALPITDSSSVVGGGLLAGNISETDVMSSAPIIPDEMAEKWLKISGGTGTIAPNGGINVIFDPGVDTVTLTLGINDANYLPG
jgi:hypothetical protein